MTAPAPAPAPAPTASSGPQSGVLSVVNSRKFWFAFVFPIAISSASVALKVITPTEYVAAITATTSVYGAAVAYEDAHS